MGAMKHIRGIDFTSAPTRSKPITVAEGELDGDALRIREMRRLTCFLDFETALEETGPWIAGIDFPFGQPRELIEALNWPRESWEDYIDHVRKMGKEGFECAIKDYTKSDDGKEHKRATDPSYAISAMHLGNPPAGKMFFQGAPRIARSGASIVPCAPNDDHRVIVEGYARPAVQALCEEKVSYKGQTPEHRQARRRIVSCLLDVPCHERYGLTVQLEPEARGECIGDPAGDLLDAVLCAVQAAWAWKQPSLAWMDAAQLEGCIADPESQRLLDLNSTS